MRRFLCFITVAGCFMLATNALADSKLGYVDVGRILRDSQQAAESAKRLKNEFSSRTAELTQLQKQINEQINAGTAKGRKLAGLKLEFDRKQRSYNEDSEIRKREELTVLQTRINKAVTTVAETESYDLVLYTGLAYASKQVNLTDKVLRLLDKSAP